MSTAKVFVGSLPSGCKPDELRRLFSNYGAVVEADVMNRCGFVHLETSDMADAAIAALNGTLFKGVSIVVEAGRPKERSRNGAGSRVPPSVGGGGGSGRRSLEGQSGGSNNRRDGGGSAGGRYGSEGGFNSNGSQFGPIRNETTFRQQRNAPYSKGPPQQQTSNESPQGYRNKFSVGSNGGRNGDDGGRRFQHRDNSDGAGPSNANRGAPQGPRRNLKNSPSNNNNDFLAGNSSFNNPRGVRQDRRGFALPVEQQQMTFGVQQNRFRNGSNSGSGNRHSSGVNGADPQGRRGSYNDRGGFNARRGAANNEHNRPQRQGGAGNKPGHDQSGGLHGSYQTEFPPLGRHEGGRGGGAVHRNRFNGPRPGPNNMGGNRRF